MASAHRVRGSEQRGSAAGVYVCVPVPSAVCMHVGMCCVVRATNLLVASAP